MRSLPRLPTDHRASRRDEHDACERRDGREPLSPAEPFDSVQLRGDRDEDRQSPEREGDGCCRGEPEGVDERHLVDDDPYDRGSSDDCEVAPADPEAVLPQQRESYPGEQPAEGCVRKRLESVGDRVAKGGEVEASNDNCREEKALGRHAAHSPRP